jgi:DNA-binding LacI/PurR family transcriptional regulator
LLHIADMVDPAFGYQPAVPEVDGGPTYARLLQDRYRALWDVSVAGFGDTSPAAQAEPPLTTVRMPREELGATAMAVALEALDARSGSIPSKTLEYGLSIRASSGPVPR